MDWKDALGSLMASGSLPDDRPDDSVLSDPSDSSDSSVSPAWLQSEPVGIVMERKGRGGKTATIVEGFLCDDTALKDLAGRIKRQLGCGGSARGGEILIQGDVREKLRPLLRSLGFRTKG